MSGTLDHGTFTLKADVKALSTALGLGTADDPVLQTYTQLFSNGSGTGQATQFVHDQRTLSASASETRVLTGSLANAFGVTVTFLTLRAVLIHAAVGNTNDVVIGANGANQWVGMFVGTADSLKVKPGGTLLWLAPAGAAVVASDVIKVTNSSSGTSVTYDIWLLGTD